MDSMKNRGRLALIAVIAATAVLAAAWAAGTNSGDKAGGAGEPVVLRMADTGSQLGYTPAVEYFVQRVTELSAGHLRIDVVHNWGNGAPDAEQQVVRDVAAGKAHLTYVGAPVFDTLNVTSFRALLAPMLIDSYALQDAVVKSDIPGQMLDGLKTLGVSGLGLVGGNLVKPLAAKRALLGPADWHGITFQAYRSRELADAIRALGATPTDTQSGLDAGLDDGSIQGFAKGLLAYEINATEHRAPYVTANVNLWPNMLVLVANPASLARLTDDQRGWLRQAAGDAAASSRSLVDREDQIVPAVCQAGAHLANASDADLAALRQAFDPVYSELEQDPQTKAFIGQIRSLKQSLPVNPPLAIPAGCTAPAPTPSVVPSPSDPLAGTWVTANITESQFVHAYVAAGGSEKDGHEAFGAQQFRVIMLQFQDGVFREYGSADGVPTGLANEGRYTIEGDGTFTLRTGCTETFGYELTGDVLQLSYLPPFCPDDGRPIGQTLYTGFPFTRSK
jgi:TRAP-type C4-dicarboxylate transport system substrate-binding protein